MSRMLSGAGLCALAIAWIAPASVLAAPSWHDGTMKTTTITNCASIAFNSPYQEQGAAAYVGVYEDTNAQPKVGDVYYVHNVVAATGNACSGQYAHIEMTPPPNSVLAISAQNPVICYLVNYTGQTPSESRDTDTRPPLADTTPPVGG